MIGTPRSLLGLLAACLLPWIVAGCGSAPAKPTPPPKPTAKAPTPPPAVREKPSTPVAKLSSPVARARADRGVMLGIDVLEESGFAALKGKRVGLLTHPAGVNRRGESTVDVLRRAPGVRLVALFGPEHGIYGNEKAEVPIPNRVDPRTRLPVYSLYGKFRKPTRDMLRGLDAVVIDLQDVGSRSYTYVSAMRLTMEACFEAGIECVVLDRPNPLGGLKVDGPMLDPKWRSYVGAFLVPYVHGLTIGELARMAAATPGAMEIPEAVRQRGRLTVVPMKGWNRAMRWPETGLRFVPTSPMVKDYAACVGYAMTGLGTYIGGFRHGVGDAYAFRGVSHKTVKIDVVERELRALRLPGLAFRRVSVPGDDGTPKYGVFIEVTDWDDFRPTELSFHLMRMACRLEARNPFAQAKQGIANGFIRHMGSEAFFRALERDGAKVNLEAYLAKWRDESRAFAVQSRRFWLYSN